MKKVKTELILSAEGFYHTNDDLSCILLATLNAIKGCYSTSVITLEKYAMRFDSLWKKDPKAEFAQPYQIPKTIEEITNKEFFGRMIAPKASEILKNADYTNARKYSINSRFINAGMLPFIYYYPETERNGVHAVAAIEFYRDRGECVIIDNGICSRRVIPADVIAYKIEKK